MLYLHTGKLVPLIKTHFYQQKKISFCQLIPSEYIQDHPVFDLLGICLDLFSFLYFAITRVSDN